MKNDRNFNLGKKKKKFIFIQFKFFFDAILFLFCRSLKIWDRQEILQFVQRNHEPYYLAWERYKDLLRDFPCHGFNREGQLMNFLDGLTSATREWVGGGTMIPFYNFTADEAYRYLEDLAGYD